MAFSYKMKSRPTEYKTRVYRSQLEANWKIFFDLITLPSEYGPYELLLPNGSTYFPDFAINFANIPIHVLAEIKPVNFTADTFHPSYDDEMFSNGTFNKCPDDILCLGIGLSAMIHNRSYGAMNISGYRK